MSSRAVFYLRYIAAELPAAGAGTSLTSLGLAVGSEIPLRAVL
jgi:hypothetical protein